MHLDATELHKFYHASQLGALVEDLLRAQILRMWPDLRGQNLVGYGYALPILNAYLDQCPGSIALMPGPQGVIRWPHGAKNRAVLCEDTRWPVQTDWVDRLLLLHGLDASEHPIALLEECYRVLAPGGRALFIVPNRLGLWARRAGTPADWAQ